MSICRIPQVADFGLSHVMHGRKHYQPEKLYGDLKFMAPEAVFGKVVSPAMDIWSLGMLIFDMMSPEGVAHDATDPEALLTFLKGPLAVLPDGTPASIQVGLQRHYLLYAAAASIAVLDYGWHNQIVLFSDIQAI